VSIPTKTNGSPAKAMNGHKRPRRELAEALAAQRKHVRGGYDAYRDDDDHKNHWAHTDALDADSSNSRAVRSKLVQRSRYEVANNGYADGIAQTYATTLAGNGGPLLRMQTGSNGFNQLIETRFSEWATAVNFSGKLWTLAHAKYVDGEGLGVIRRNPGIANQIKLDWCLYETEQCQTPYLPYGKPGFIDGIQFDQFGNPTFYEFLKYHPGGTNNSLGSLGMDTELVPARFVTHWYKQRRPGQHRGIPETTSTLTLGAAARRWRESTLAKAEMQAKLTVLLKSLIQPSSEDADNIAAMSTLEMLTGMMIALPNSVDPVQMDMDTPGAQYESFHKTLVNEQARPKSMPYIVAACDASGSNYATGRLDHQNYYAALDTDRDDCDRQVLNVIFDAWFDSAVRAYGWLGGNPEAIGAAGRAHDWAWPKHRVIDESTEASSRDTRLKNGSTSLAKICDDDGGDYEDDVVKQAASNGIEPEVQRQINLLLNMPQHVLPFAAQLIGIKLPQPAGQKPAPKEAADAKAE
jgi:capsid protein